MAWPRTAYLLVFAVAARAEMPCVDSNEDCRDWAQIGECEKNPDYVRALS